MISLKHALMETLLSQLLGSHATSVETRHLRLNSTLPTHTSKLLIVDTLRRVIIIILAMKLIRIINTTRILHEMLIRAHVLLTVVRVLLNTHTLVHIHSRLTLYVLVVSILLVVVLHLIN